MIKTSAAFLEHLTQRYPGLSNAPLGTDLPLSSLVSENLISPHSVSIPGKALRQAQAAAKAFYELRENCDYQKFVGSTFKDPKNKSIMMSYDYHLTKEGDLKLIEVNTNAAFLILGYELYKMKKMALPIPNFSTDSIKNSILSELSLFGNSTAKPALVITDREPEKQRLFIEFLIYQELFKSFGWQSSILDVSELSKNSTPDFIYNRSTDFYFENPESENIRHLFESGKSCVSPNPFDYSLLADKQRMIDWGTNDHLSQWKISSESIQAINSVLPACFEMNVASAEALWAKKKSLFFKPKREFGSKHAFKGASISRKVFDELIEKNGIAQDYIAAPEHIVTTPAGEEKFKFDLRCFAYQGELQLIVARLYQGQVTNLRTKNGGFGCVIINDEK